MPNIIKPSFRWTLAGRVVVALLGGYAFCWGLVAAGVALLFALGVRFHDAEILSWIVAFLAYLGVMLWVAATRHPGRALAMLIGGAGLLAGSASLAQRLFVA